MDVSIGQSWEEAIDEAVKAGRYASPSEMVQEGLRLLAERDAKLRALRATLNASIERGGRRTPGEVRRSVNEALKQWGSERAAS